MTVAIKGLSRNATLRAWVAERMGAALEPLRVKPLTARVAFFDDDGPKGGRAVRCAFTVRLPRRPAIRVEHTAETGRLAFDMGLATLERQLRRTRERTRQSRRRPKKYFLARRLIGIGPEEAPGPPEAS